MCNRNSYYQFLQEELGSGESADSEFLRHLPDFYLLLADLLNMIQLDREDRAYVCGALAYLVAPADWIPEIIHGPEGYIDDLFVVCYVIAYLSSKYGIEPIAGVWEGKDDFKTAHSKCLEHTTERMDKLGLTQKCLKYIGLA